MYWFRKGEIAPVEAKSKHPGGADAIHREIHDGRTGAQMTSIAFSSVW